MRRRLIDMRNSGSVKRHTRRHNTLSHVQNFLSDDPLHTTLGVHHYRAQIVVDDSRPGFITAEHLAHLFGDGSDGAAAEAIERMMK